MRVLLALAFLSGCSLLLVQGPPKEPTVSAPACDTSARGPITGDVLLASTVAIVGLSAAAGVDADRTPGDDSSAQSAAIVGVTAVAVVGFTYSIIKGVNRARACRSAMLDWGSQRFHAVNLSVNASP